MSLLIWQWTSFHNITIVIGQPKFFMSSSVFSKNQIMLLIVFSIFKKVFCTSLVSNYVWFYLPPLTDRLNSNVIWSEMQAMTLFVWMYVSNTTNNWTICQYPNPIKLFGMITLRLVQKFPAKSWIKKNIRVDKNWHTAVSICDDSSFVDRLHRRVKSQSNLFAFIAKWALSPEHNAA